MARQLVINLASLSERPTGLGVYSENLVPLLADLDPIVLIRRSLVQSWTSRFPRLNLEEIRDDLSSDNGAKGHARRLAWIESTLVRRLSRLRSPILFSPVPEAPICRPTPTIVTVHDFTPLRFFGRAEPLYQYSKRYIPKVLASAEAILCISEATAEDAVKLAGADRRRIFVTPLACDVRHFKPLGLPRRNYFLYVGQYKPYKNIETALRAFERLNAPGIEFWLAGPRDRGFDRLIAEFRDRRRLPVRFLEYPSFASLPTLINEALGLVFPSRWEGFGLPILEAMSCGTPVITSHAASMPEVAGGAALLIDPDDETGLAGAMAGLLNDPSLSDILTQKGLLRSRDFSWSKTASLTRSVLERSLAAR